MTPLQEQIAQRRTFAIISHPDAGKTTLTEKLLLFGGAIQLAGAVKTRGQQRRARSDWMKVEQERGISVTVSVMTFGYDGFAFNLLDTPGHEDFSEDTYRTLTAVDSAVMVIDAAKGIETQTRKLFEVCRLRDIPIITFINKLDREGRDPFALLEQIEHELALETSPITWPVGMGQDFLGCYNLHSDTLLLMEKNRERIGETTAICHGLDDDQLKQHLPAPALAKLQEEAHMVRELCHPFKLEAFRAGHRTPVFFGSALNNFGVHDLLSGLGRWAPPPRPQPTTTRQIQPDEPGVSAFTFKIQANMDPKHRDRIAFVRICSGHFQRGMKLLHVRTGKQMVIHNPLLFLAQDRERVEDAWPGDIIGIPNHGVLRIGDTLTEGEPLQFTGIPSFAPELLRLVRTDDPMRAKHLGRTLQQLGEEGAARVFKKRLGGDWIIGVLGNLQFEVLADRIRTEFNIPVHYEGTSLFTARWVEADDPHELKRFQDQNLPALADDHTEAVVFLARNSWHLETTQSEWPKLKFLKTKEQTK
ncbi:MAG: peptide chain release factor 3 [Magnetococcales bacterium]|nr:peptide chain release factor 3 [Magnetococcales bacterium]